MCGQCCSQKTCIIKQTKNDLCQAWNTSLQVYDQGSQRPQKTQPVATVLVAYHN